MQQFTEGVGGNDNMSPSMLKRFQAATKPYGEVELVKTSLIDGERQIVDRRVLENVFTDVGKEAAADLFANINNISPFDWLAIGENDANDDDSPDDTSASAGDTALNDELVDAGSSQVRLQDSNPNLITVNVNNDTAEIQQTWDFAASGGDVDVDADVRELGLFNDSSAGTMAARRVFDILSMRTATEDSLTLIWRVTFS